MFNIKLADIGGDGKLVEFNTVVETLKEAELLTGAAVAKHLGVCEVQLVHENDLVYDIIVDGCSVGVAVIRSF